jgi:hypothetical protein
MKLVTLSRKSLLFVRPVLFRPWFYLALGIHAGLLWLPLPSDSEQAEIPPEEEVIKITQLAASPDEESDTEGNTKATSAGEIATQSSLPKANPLPPFTPPRTNPYTPFTVTTPEFDREIAFSPQPTLTPSPRPTPQPENTPTPSPSPSPSPSPTNTPENAPPSDNTPEDKTTSPGGSTHNSSNSGLLGTRGNTGDNSGESGTTAQPDDFFALFPRYPNAQQGSGEVLRNEFETAAYLYNTPDSLDRVIAQFDNDLLQNTPFRWQKTLEDGNFKVYQVTNTETSETKYLHLLSQNEKTVLYLEENDYTLAQLSEAEVEKMGDVEFSFIIAAADLDKVRSDIIANHPRATQFQDRDNFAFYKSKQVVNNPSTFAEQIKQATNTILPASQFIPLNDSDGSLTYKVVNEGSYTYLMFVQGDDGQSVMIISPTNPLANT